MQLLNTMMLPGLNINPMANTISSSDGGKVVLQINGVNATPEEVQTVSSKVDFHQSGIEKGTRERVRSKVAKFGYHYKFLSSF